MKIVHYLKKLHQQLFAEITFIPDVVQTKYLPSLNGFRAISILLVLLDHFTFNYSHKFEYKILLIGNLGVNIFFVISGFLITTLLLKEKVSTGNISLKKFYIRRFFRIIPVSYLYIIVLLILNHFFNLNISLLGFIGAFLFLGNIGLFHNNWYTSHYWSLAFEEQFYLVFPFILKKNFKFYVWFLLMMLLVVFVLRQFEFVELKNTNPILYRFQYLKEVTFYLDGIIIGSLFSILTIKNMLPVKQFLAHKTIIHIILVPLIVLIHCGYLPVLNNTANSYVSSVMIGILILSNIQPATDPIFKLLNNRLINYIGILSYSIYIWQQLFVYNQPWKDHIAGSDTIWINVLLLMLVAYVSYNFYEKQFLKLKERIK
jgi:peptidoglycan/LPS O-acetylase OafA/YrhL